MKTLKTILQYGLIGFLIYASPTFAEEHIMKTATGTFDINLTPEDDGDMAMGRLTFHKSFQGDMVGNSIGQMLSHRSDVAGSAGYVAMEKLSVTLNDLSGSFYLLHSGTMQAETLSQTISIVPDSGTDALSSISGTLIIEIKNGVHHYRLNYQLN